MIYFAQLPTGAIKIGKTDDIDRRMRGLNTKSGKFAHSCSTDCVDWAR